jgi:hypothetical protein
MSIKRENLILPIVAPAGTDYTGGEGRFVKADGSYATADAGVFGVRLAAGVNPARGAMLGAGADGAVVVETGGVAVALGASEDGEDVAAVLLPFAAIPAGE